LIGDSVPSYEQVNEEKSFVRNLGKYFLHGFVYSIVMTFSSIVLVFIVVFLITFGSIIGLVLGFCVIFITMGMINRELAKYFWEIETSNEWLSLLKHGFLLFLALLVVGIPGMIFELGLINLDIGTIILYYIVFLLVFSIIDGYEDKFGNPIYPRTFRILQEIRGFLVIADG
jgi:ABC-type transport system involved in multi-copper enzyme maturation permease subunit